MPSPNLGTQLSVLKVGLVNNGSAESACLENVTPNQITGLLQVTRVKLLTQAGGVVRRHLVGYKLQPIKKVLNLYH